MNCLIGCFCCGPGPISWTTCSSKNLPYRFPLFFALFLLFLVSCQSTVGPYYASLYAGNGVQGTSPDGNVADGSSLNVPWGLWMDTTGVVYVAERNINKVRAISTSGQLSTFASPPGAPICVWGNSVGSVYITDYSSYKVSVVSNGILTTFAGIGSTTSDSGDGGPATSAALNFPLIVGGDSNGNVYILDSSAYTVRKVSSSNLISTVAGKNGVAGTPANGAAATSSAIGAQYGITADTNGSLYFSDASIFRIYMISTSGSIIYVAGTGSSGTYAADNLAATSTALYDGRIYGLQVFDNVLLFSEYNSYKVKVIDSSNLVYTIAGTGTDSSNSYFGAATSVAFAYPNGVCGLSLDTLYVVALGYNSVLKLTPTLPPTPLPNISPTYGPTTKPSLRPTKSPTVRPSLGPTRVPSVLPTVSVQPSISPTVLPTVLPTISFIPTLQPSVLPSTSQPSSQPSSKPSSPPSSLPTNKPSTSKPTIAPTTVPTVIPSELPSVVPTLVPSEAPSLIPTAQPSISPSALPSLCPTVTPSLAPSQTPSTFPTLAPTFIPSVAPSQVPSNLPTLSPSTIPSIYPSVVPSPDPSIVPSLIPSALPSVIPSNIPSRIPTVLPTVCPSTSPSMKPTVLPSEAPSQLPTLVPTILPSFAPSTTPSLIPSAVPSENPTAVPSELPTVCPSVYPTYIPTNSPSVMPSMGPTMQPSLLPSALPSCFPSLCPSEITSDSPSHTPTIMPSAVSNVVPSGQPSISFGPTLSPSNEPSRDPTIDPSVHPTMSPSFVPFVEPSAVPSLQPSLKPSVTPSVAPSAQPSRMPTLTPSMVPSVNPSVAPSGFPTAEPTFEHLTCASLPVNHSGVSVVGTADFSFKTVLPVTLLSYSISSSTVLNDLDLSNLVSSAEHSTLYSGRGIRNISSSIVTSAVAEDSYFRSSAVVNDFNGDGHTDLIIGDPFGSKVYVLFGTNQGLTHVNSGFTIFGEQDSDLTGWSVSDAGDVNNDTLHDIIIGAPVAKGMGAFYVLFGQKINCDVYLNTLNASQGFAVYGSRTADYLGISVSGAGDVNGDGFDDLVVGAVLTSKYFAGGVLTLYGGPKLQLPNSLTEFGAKDGYMLTGSSYSYTGCSVSGAGDVNGDGYDDVIIGSFPQRSSVAAESFLLLGTDSLRNNAALTSMASNSLIHISGTALIVSGVGDYNHDRLGDFIVVPRCPSAMYGCLVRTNVNDMTLWTPEPSVAPTAAVTFVSTFRPSTRRPSVQASRLPTLMPTAKPSHPTGQPNAEHNDEPSVDPSTEPSEMPTETPTVDPSDVPSQLPTEMPSMQPSLNPSHIPQNIPAVVPSIAPTEAPASVPTQGVLTRKPFTAPTLVPTVTVTASHAVHIDGGVDLEDQLLSNVTYFINTAEQVSIYNAMGGNKYVMSSNPSGLLIIQYFNNTNDVIDLTAFTSITAFSQLLITSGSVIITLPNNQIVRIMNLYPRDVNGSCFVFYQDGSVGSTNKAIEKVTEFVGIGLGIGGVIFIVVFILPCSYLLYEAARKKQTVQPFWLYNIVEEIESDESSIESQVESYQAYSSDSDDATAYEKFVSGKHDALLEVEFDADFSGYQYFLAPIVEPVEQPVVPVQYKQSVVPSLYELSSSSSSDKQTL